jgi:hypothetical protein
MALKLLLFACRKHTNSGNESKFTLTDCLVNIHSHFVYLWNFHHKNPFSSLLDRKPFSSYLQSINVFLEKVKSFITDLNDIPAPFHFKTDSWDISPQSSWLSASEISLQLLKLDFFMHSRSCSLHAFQISSRLMRLQVSPHISLPMLFLIVKTNWLG